MTFMIVYLFSAKVDAFVIKFWYLEIVVEMSQKDIQLL